MKKILLFGLFTIFVSSFALAAIEECTDHPLHPKVVGYPDYERISANDLDQHCIEIGAAMYQHIYYCCSEKIKF